MVAAAVTFPGDDESAVLLLEADARAGERLILRLADGIDELNELKRSKR
ncbi:MAG: hypothetical protein ACJ76I_13710 [Gaiellaceae bacterium]